MAHALTRSHGTQTVRPDGPRGREPNREVFVLRRPDGAWKIARYLFGKPE